jgi:hypothetical protein
VKDAARVDETPAAGAAEQPGAVAHDDDVEEPAPGTAARKGNMATKGQLTMLAVLAHELGMDDTARHEAAGVDTFKALTRDEAHDLIEEWQRRAFAAPQTSSPDGVVSTPDDVGEPAPEGPAGEDAPGPSGFGAVDPPDPDGLPSAELANRALRHFVTRPKILAAVRAAYPELQGTDALKDYHQITHTQMVTALEAGLKVLSA